MLQDLSPLQLGPTNFSFGPFPFLIGILNVTPDSFSDGDLYHNPKQALKHALDLQAQGADLIEIGAESTRPGATAITVQKELDRLLPVLDVLRDQINLPVSLDTRKVKVAEKLLSYGVDLINDVSAFEFDKEMIPFLAQHHLPAVLMHSRGNPQTMSSLNRYPNIMEELCRFFEEKLEALDKKKVDLRKIILDPGVGFAKTGSQNVQLLAYLKQLQKFRRPLMIGLSRKSFLKKYFEEDHVPRDRSTLSEVAHALCLNQGIQFLRVHNVAAARRTCTLVNDFLSSPSPFEGEGRERG
ncbi:MAG: dihydropteroate synthase [Deltaproteobacteria bacterium]|nr:dihydropteroate synthase [Deltaproteobacteria bacterium]